MQKSLDQHRDIFDLSNEAAQTQSEPVADRETEAQHGDNSIAASSQEQSKATEGEPAETEPAQQSPPEQSQQEHSTLGELASSAADKAKETASSAYDAITGESSDAGVFGQRKPDHPPSASIYVGNLFFDVKEEDLRKQFEKCGPIESIKIILDNRGLSKGFGYVNYANIEAATNAVRDFNMQSFEGRRLTVQYAAVRNPTNRDPRTRVAASQPSRTLFIGNMAFDMSDRELNQLFREVRNVVDVRVAIDRRTGQPRGFAHADFTDVESAKEAMLYLSGKEVCGRALRVDYSQSTGRALGTQGPAEGR
ncbi:MAG: hypothetical protein Q9181_002399 [Wetmoreana brouardii]